MITIKRLIITFCLASQVFNTAHAANSQELKSYALLSGSLASLAMGLYLTSIAGNYDVLGHRALEESYEDLANGFSACKDDVRQRNAGKHFRARNNFAVFSLPFYGAGIYGLSAFVTK